MVAIEGDHLLEEALRSGMVLKTVFVSETARGAEDRAAWGGGAAAG